MTASQPWSRWITVEQIQFLHKQGLDRYGGLAIIPITATGCIEGSLGAAYNAELYAMPEIEGETIISGLVFCGHLLFYLITKNCFTDGNKRAGWLSAMRVLLTLGLTVEATDDEAEAFCLAVATGAIRQPEQAIAWIAERLRAIE